jgi:hypothetical protein
LFEGWIAIYRGGEFVTLADLIAAVLNSQEASDNGCVKPHVFGLRLLLPNGTPVQDVEIKDHSILLGAAE